MCEFLAKAGNEKALEWQCLAKALDSYLVVLSFRISLCEAGNEKSTVVHLKLLCLILI